jgi:hypothetical protein
MNKTEWSETLYCGQVKRAALYVKTIVVESDGYPMLHTAESLRTLLVNAFIAGMDTAKLEGGKSDVH